MMLQLIDNQHFMESIGWTLLHSLWQILLISAVLFCSLRLLENASANLRYLVCISALFLALIMPITTFISLSTNPSLKVENSIIQKNNNGANPASSNVSKNIEVSEKNDNSPKTVSTDNQTASITVVNLQVQAERLFTNFLPYLVWLWLFGVLLFSLRFGVGVWQTHQLKTQNNSLVDNDWQDKFDKLCEMVGIFKPIKFLQSEIVQTPMVIGWLKPFVIVPSSVLLGLNPRELETIIVHELIHIRRHDYFINILQSFVEIVLFFHPLTWWISAQVRRERENACDDEVLKIFKNESLLYANALANLEDFRTQSTNLTPPNILAANGGNLMFRIQRIIKKNTEMRNARESFWSAIPAFLLISAIVITVFSTEFRSGVNAENIKNSPAAKKIAVGFVSIPPLDRSEAPPKESDATARLMIAKLTQYKIPAVGFVLGGAISDGDKLYPVRANIVRLWRDAGFEIGIGNYKHVWFFDTPFEEYTAGVEKNERIVKKILAEKNLPLRYFSYPYLNTGKSNDDHIKFEKWLKDRNLSAVKYTIDNQEWMYSYAYDMARNDNDVNMMKEVQAEFIDYMTKIFDHFETYSKEMFGRDIAQTMVLTPSRLVADSSDELFGMIQKRGYQFVSMDEAQKDEAYQTPETFTGKSGISWFERWQMAKGKKLLDEPNVHADVWKSWNTYKPKN